MHRFISKRQLLSWSPPSNWKRSKRSLSAPISIPGLPIETVSGGIKAPQYFGPGVAGDHGEPIAQFSQVWNFLFPNNLPASAHDNGYADPNFLIASEYTGQTTESIAGMTGPRAMECVVGVTLKSYVSLSWTYSFGKAGAATEVY